MNGIERRRRWPRREEAEAQEKSKGGDTSPQDQAPGEKPKEPDQRETVGQFPIPPKLVELLLLGPVDDRRVLQDSPILGDVWLAYAGNPGSTQDLLITPHKDTTAAAVAAAISAALKHKGAKIAYLQGIVAATLSFEEVLLILVPLTQWWNEPGIKAEIKKNEEEGPENVRSKLKSFLDK